MTQFDVFISRKSTDAKIAKELFIFLQKSGLKVFDSDISLHEIGIAEYQRTIDNILDEVQHIIVVGSSIENINSAWVKTEWETFENEKRSGRKNGNLLVVITKNVSIEKLPLSLRQKQVFRFEDKNFDLLLPYLGITSQNLITPHKDYKNSKKKMVGFTILLAVVFISIAIYLIVSPQKIPIKSNPTINTDSLFKVTKKKFLYEGLDKEIAFKNFKLVTKQNPNIATEIVDIFGQKAQKVPFLKDKYLNYSEQILLYADSLNKNK